MAAGIALLALSVPLSYAQSDLAESRFKYLARLSPEELRNLRVTSATLTDTDSRYIPAAVTTIDLEDIERSGARTLNELLQIYVPGLQLIRHHFNVSHLGTRGIISDTEDKYILLVNGRVMNQRTQIGIISERDLMLLADIHHIEVIRGPGSALYGLGAISMVVAITTLDGETFQGTEMNAKIGQGEERYGFELKHGLRFGQDGALFLYGGL